MPSKVMHLKPQYTSLRWRATPNISPHPSSSLCIQVHFIRTHSRTIAISHILYISNVTALVSEEPLNLNFLVYSSRRPLPIPVRFINEELSVALRRGSFVVRINRFIPCVVAPGTLPPKHVDVDLSNVGVGETVRVNREIGRASCRERVL